MTEKKTPEIIFAPGCFDTFEGTQEELDALMADIMKMFETGEAPESIEFIELTEEDLEDFEEDFDEPLEPRTLQ
jgi:hypothetical protein